MLLEFSIKYSVLCFCRCNRYIVPEQVPVQYGGLSKDGDQEFCPADSVTEITLKPTTKQTVEFPVSEVGSFISCPYFV